MPSTKRVRHPESLIRPVDHQSEIARIRALGLDPDVTLVAETYISSLRTAASVRSTRVTLTSCLRELADIGVNPLHAKGPDLLRWWNGTTRLAPRSRLNRRAILKSFYRVAKGLDLITKDPMWSITPVRDEVVVPTPALSVEQAEQLIESIRAEFDHPDRALMARRDFAVIALALRMCLRAAEIAGLRWENIAEDDGQRTARFIGKYSKIASLSVPDDVWEALVAWRMEFERQVGVRMQQRDPVVVSLSNAAFFAAQNRQTGVPLAPLASTMISTIAMNRLADIHLVAPRMAAHALRATGATLARKGGADLLEIQTLLRHEKLDTTRIYLKDEDVQARPAMERMPIRLDRDNSAASGS
jgi:integrase